MIRRNFIKLGFTAVASLFIRSKKRGKKPNADIIELDTKLSYDYISPNYFSHQWPTTLDLIETSSDVYETDKYYYYWSNKDAVYFQIKKSRSKEL